MYVRGAIVTALVLISLFCTTTADSNVVRFSEQLCRTDAVCAIRWFGGVSPTAAANSERFDEMFQRAVLRESSGDELRVDAILEQCVAANNCSTETQLLTLALLRELSPCDVNEEWVFGHGCVCQDGKTCDVDCTQEVIADLWSAVVGLCIVFVVILATTVWEMRNDAQISRRLDSIERDITDLHRQKMQEVTPVL